MAAGASPVWSQLEATINRRQLHEAGTGRVSTARWNLKGMREPEPTFPVRACGMEAEEKPQHRAKAKPCKAGVSGSKGERARQRDARYQAES